MLEALGLTEDEGPFFGAKGCGECLNTGFQGRIGLYEIMPMSRVLYSCICAGAPSGEVHVQAVENGMLTLRADGLEKARAGETTLDEVFEMTGGMLAR